MIGVKKKLDRSDEKKAGWGVEEFLGMKKLGIPP